MSPVLVIGMVELLSWKPTGSSVETAVIYYTGTFSIFGDRIEASARITKHNPSWANAFGDDATQFEIRVLGRIEGEAMLANMERLDRPGFSVPLRLTRKAPLP